MPVTGALKCVRYIPQLKKWFEVAAAVGRGWLVTKLRLRNGIMIQGRPSSALLGKFKEIWYRDAYRLQHPPIRPHGTVIDIGANVGVFAIYAASIGRAARVLCYEPFPASYELLCHNAAQNCLGSIETYQQAVGGTPGQRTLYVRDQDGHNSLLGSRGEPSIAVDCVTLAEVVENRGIDRCDFLKLDCEGAEYEILLQAPPSVLRRVGRIALEWHAFGPYGYQELEELFRSTGFHVHVVVHKRGQSGYLFASSESP